jgi:hypothetical protein
MARSRFSSLVSLLPLFLVPVACADDSVVTPGNGGGGGGAGGNGGGSNGGGTAVVGETCGAQEDCRGGLDCVSQKCDFAHATVEGDRCTASGDCKDGLKCAPGLYTPPSAAKPIPANVCTTLATDAGPEGTGCISDTGCQAGLRCGIVGFGAQCVPEGTADLGQTCTLSGDCYSGLICAPPLPAVAGGSDAGAAPGPSTCAPVPPVGGVPFGIPVPPVLHCKTNEAGAPVTAYFEVPGAADTEPDGDFFRLPFPNDARITKGKIDLTGFPTPGKALLGFDPVQIYVDAIAANQSAWGASPTTFFRFSGHLDAASVTFVAGQSSPVRYLDVTDPTTQSYGGSGWSYSPNAGKYICQDVLTVRGGLLEPGHVYAVVITDALKDTKGNKVQRSPEFAAMLDAKVPTDAGLANAYAAYKPLRDYLKAPGFNGKVTEAEIVGGTVFTVGPLRTPMAALAKAALAEPAPLASEWVRCGGDAASPCPQAEGTRACGTGGKDFVEYQALVSIPVFQKGTAPYLTDGGDIASKPVRSEKVCVSLTVPTGSPPPAGFPIAVFAHGTGGSFRDHVRDEVAGVLARATPAIAVLGYDQVQHGPRRGASTASPNNLFFNFKNPAAAQGNPMQGGADVISMGRFAENPANAIPAAVTGSKLINFDPASTVFFGHSQGSMHGSLGLPYSPAYSAAVLSGNGASLMHALLTKTAPENIAAAVPFALGGDYDRDGKLAGGEMHPVLTLLQQWIDPADPLNFAGSIAAAPETGMKPKSVFQTYGLGDTFSPPLTLEKYALAASLDLAAHDSSVDTADDIGGLKELKVPLSGNFTLKGVAPAVDQTVTLAVREYANKTGKDGHFVVFDVPSANADAIRFLSMAAGGKLPQVGE